VSVTLLAIMQAVARALDDEGTYPSSAATSTTATFGVLANSTSSASTRRYDGRYLLVASGTGIGQQRRINPNTYVPSTGAVTVNAAWTINPGTNDLILMASLFPPFEGLTPGEDTSYRTLINRGLEKLLVPRRVTLSITTSDSYALTTWPWLDRDARLLAVLEPSVQTGRQAVDASWRGPRMIVSGGTGNVLTLKTPFASASGSLTLETLSPVSRWINGAESSAGLVSLTDTAEVTIPDAITAILPEAYQALMARNNGNPTGEWARKLADARANAAALRYYDDTLTKPAAPAPAAAEAA